MKFCHTEQFFDPNSRTATSSNKTPFERAGLHSVATLEQILGVDKEDGIIPFEHAQVLASNALAGILKERDERRWLHYRDLERLQMAPITSSLSVEADQGEIIIEMGLRLGQLARSAMYSKGDGIELGHIELIDSTSSPAEAEEHARHKAEEINERAGLSWTPIEPSITISTATREVNGRTLYGIRDKRVIAGIVDTDVIEYTRTFASVVPVDTATMTEEEVIRAYVDAQRDVAGTQFIKNGRPHGIFENNQSFVTFGEVTLVAAKQ